MSRYYRILEKARRAGEIFDTGDGDGDAPRPLVDGDAADSSSHDLVSDVEPAKTKPEPKLQPWQQALADVVENPELSSISRLGLFALDAPGLSPLAVAVAEWMAKRAAGPVLLVEAYWRRSAGVAGLLHLDRRGLGEALNEPDGRLDLLIQQAGSPNLSVLGCGEAPRVSGARMGGKVATLLSSLRRRYAHVLVVMPPPENPGWSALVEAGAVEAGLLAIRPQSANRRRTELAAKTLQESSLLVAGCLVDNGAGAQVAQRLSHASSTPVSAPIEREL